MPATIPPWIRAAQPAPLYAKGMALGLQAAEQQAQAAYRQQALAAEAEQQQLRADLAREQMQIEQQRNAVEQERYRQQIELDRAEEQRKADLASRQYAAQTEYRTRVSQGEDAMNVLSEMWPALGGAGVEAALIRSQAAAQGKNIKPPERFDLGGGTQGVWNPQTGAFQLLREQGSMTEYQRESLVERMQRQVDKMTEGNADLSLEQPDPEWNARRKSAWTAGKASIRAIENRMQQLEGGGSLVPAGSAAPDKRQVLPMPKSKDAAVKGQLYQTKFGPMEWDGLAFVTPGS